MKSILLLIILLFVVRFSLAQRYSPQLALNQPVTPGTVSEQKALFTIVASNPISQNAQAFYTAGQSIRLQPGFVAQTGSVFRATIKSMAALQTASEGSGLQVRAYPNPFVEQTTLEYNSVLEGTVQYTLTDTKGQIVHQSQEPSVPSTGIHQFQLDGRRLPAGVYVYQVQVGSQVRTVRIIKKP